MNYIIELINVGRDKVNKTYKVKAHDLEDAADIAFEKIKKHIKSTIVGLDPLDDERHVWDVVVGFRTIGQVRIEKDERN